MRLAGEFQRIALSATVRAARAGREWVGGCERARRGRPGAYRRRRSRSSLRRTPKRYDLERYVSPAMPWKRRESVARRRVGMAGRRAPAAARAQPLDAGLRQQPADGREAHPPRQRGPARASVVVLAPRLALARDARGGRGAAQGGRAARHRGHQLARARHRHRRPRRGGAGPDAAVGRVGGAAHRPRRATRSGRRAAAASCRSTRATCSTPRWSRGPCSTGEIEPVRPVEGALDVLAQVIVSMTAGETWRVDDLFAAVRARDAVPRPPAAPVRPRARDAGRPLRRGPRAGAEAARRHRPRGRNGARAPGAREARLPGRRHDPRPRLLPPAGRRRRRAARRARRGVRLGAVGRRRLHPRRADLADRAHHRTTTCSCARPTARRRWPRSGAPTSATAASSSPSGSALFLERRSRAPRRPRPGSSGSRPSTASQPAAAGRCSATSRRSGRRPARFPHRHRLVVERVADPQGEGDRSQMILHTLWGGTGEPAVRARPAGRVGATLRRPLEVIHDDDCVVARRAGAGPGGRAARRSWAPAMSRGCCATQLERTGFFGARFRDAAGVRAAAAARGVPPPHAAVAVAAARQGAARGGAPLRRLPDRARGLAHLPRRRLRPRRPQARPRRAARRAASRCAR